MLRVTVSLVRVPKTYYAVPGHTVLLRVVWNTLDRVQSTERIDVPSDLSLVDHEK